MSYVNLQIGRSQIDGSHIQGDILEEIRDITDTKTRHKIVRNKTIRKYHFQRILIIARLKQSYFAEFHGN